jgi:hypothetical protein
MPPDSSDIDNALIGYLAGDAALRAQLPDGVYQDEAVPGAKQYALVTVVDAVDYDVFDGEGFESVLYQITAVLLQGAAGNIKAAAARLHELLQEQTFPIPGFTLMACYRENRVRGTEVDTNDPDIRYFHRGGRYRVQATPTVAAVTTEKGT